MPNARMIPIALVQQGQWMASVCNACRYCEGFCATFPALERRLNFAEADLTYLANLCHNCGACHYACQYAPPHEFQVNFPRMMAQLREASYQKYAWPGGFAALYERNGVVVAIATVLSLLAFMLGMMVLVDPVVFRGAHPDTAGAFYTVMPHGVMAAMFGVVALFVLTACAIGFLRFWRDTDERLADFLSSAATRQALDEALRLRYLGGGDENEGCTYPGEQSSLVRRRFHHLTFYGFMLCFSATCVATFYHYSLGWYAPYPLLSLPVILGVVGGVGLVVGPVGLLWLRAVRDRVLTDEKQAGMDVGFLILLLLSGITGLSLLAWRENHAMGVLLAVHLAIVMALFLTMPYGKFVHGFYRYAALVRYSLERARPAPKFSSD